MGTNLAHETASQFFLLRNFAKAQETLTASDFTLSLKPWLLYLALCDRAFVEPDSLEWPLKGDQRTTLRRAVQKSTFWKTLQSQFDEANAPIPTAVILSGIKLATKHNSDPAPIIAFMESYMAQHPPPESLFLAFVKDVLVNLQHDFYYARQLADLQLAGNEIAHESLVKYINGKEAEHNQKQEKERERMYFLEKQRVELAIARSAKGKSIAAESESEGETQIETSEEDSKMATTKSFSQIKDTWQRRRNDVHADRASLPELWRKWIHDFVRSQGFYNTLILLSLVIAATSNRQLRRAINSGAKWAWQTIKTSLQMGLRVTYL